MLYYVDESGSIPSFRSNKWKNRYFLIAFVHTENIGILKRVHNRSLSNVRKHYPDLFDENNELKASVTPPFIKEYLIRRLLTKTDVQFGYILVDNWNIRDQFRRYKSRSFNYLIKLAMISHEYCDECINHLRLNIDNRNSKITNLDALESHLYDVLVLEKELTDEVSVKYLESHENTNIQVADLIANTIYQYYRYRNIKFRLNELDETKNIHCPQSYKYLYNMLRQRLFYYQEFPGGRSKQNTTLRKVIPVAN